MDAKLIAQLIGSHDRASVLDFVPIMHRDERTVKARIQVNCRILKLKHSLHAFRMGILGIFNTMYFNS